MSWLQVGVSLFVVVLFAGLLYEAIKELSRIAGLLEEIRDALEEDDTSSE